MSVLAEEVAPGRAVWRPPNNRPWLAAYVDSVKAAVTQYVVVVGVDPSGGKRVLGMGPGGHGPDERGRATRDLLGDLVRRGFARERRPLFVTDGSEPVRWAVAEQFGAGTFVQACRAHRTREVLGCLPGRERVEARRAIEAAWKRGLDGGRGRLAELAVELERRGRTAAAAKMSGRSRDLFTVDRLGLHPQLRRSLSTTHIIAGVRLEMPGDPDGEDDAPDETAALRYAAATFRDAERRYRRIAGYRHLQLLKDHLDQIDLPL